ncbi:MAG: hypothetical protein ACLRH0_05315 [Blautia wexlerae]
MAAERVKRVAQAFQIEPVKEFYKDGEIYSRGVVGGGLVLSTGTGLSSTERDSTGYD